MSSEPDQTGGKGGEASMGEDEGWTLGTLRLHLEAQLSLTQAQAAMTNAALERAETRANDIHETLRATLADHSAQLISRTEALARADSNSNRINTLAERVDRLEGASVGSSRTTALFLTLGALLLSLATIAITVLTLR